MKPAICGISAGRGVICVPKPAPSLRHCHHNAPALAPAVHPGMGLGQTRKGERAVYDWFQRARFRQLHKLGQIFRFFRRHATERAFCADAAGEHVREAACDGQIPALLIERGTHFAKVLAPTVSAITS